MKNEWYARHIVIILMIKSSLLEWNKIVKFQKNHSGIHTYY